MRWIVRLKGSRPCLWPRSPNTYITVIIMKTVGWFIVADVNLPTLKILSALAVPEQFYTQLWARPDRSKTFSRFHQSNLLNWRCWNKGNIFPVMKLKNWSGNLFTTQLTPFIQITNASWFISTAPNHSQTVVAKVCSLQKSVWIIDAFW